MGKPERFVNSERVEMDTERVSRRPAPNGRSAKVR